MQSDQAQAQVVKRFFISLITRDITLEDAILDLIDNSVNCALREYEFDSRRIGALIAGSNGPTRKLRDINIHLSERRFEITDYCGGIDLDSARRDMFQFGRDAPGQSHDILSVYGIGLKRAIFKLGQRIVVTSHRADTAFRVDIDVEDWSKKPADWFFPLQQINAAEAGIKNGTTITVTELYPQIQERTKLVLRGDLQGKIASTYSLFVNSVVKLRVNDVEIPGVPLTVTEGAQIDEFETEGCRVRIIATLTPGDHGPWTAETGGWYILCNGRTVVAADKTTRTGWGDLMPMFVSKYRAFRGIVNFLAEDPERLPWTTTKTDVNQESAVYQQALPRMSTTARPVLAYLNSVYSASEVDTAPARAAAEVLTTRPLSELMARPVTSFTPPPVTQPRTTRVQFDAKLTEIAEIQRHIRRQSSASRIGRMCFDYYLKNVVGV
jgi:Histidine kinase-, DNA gyrase B-, and HSP90-like ATPase